MAGPERDDSGRATVREVYHLVGEVEQKLETVRNELGDKIDRLGTTVSGLVVSHEHRLTKVETTQDDHADQLGNHTARIRSLEESNANARGHVSALKWVVGGAIGLVATGLSGLFADLIYGAIK